MKVKDLIVELQALDQNLNVLVAGYEGGYNLADPSLETRKFKLDPEPFCGDYDTIVADAGRFDIEGVIINRKIH